MKAWKVYKKNRWIGIVESNYAWAIKYWTPRKCKLVEVDCEDLRKGSYYSV